jgi:hypothetical protein
LYITVLLGYFLGVLAVLGNLLRVFTMLAEPAELVEGEGAVTIRAEWDAVLHAAHRSSFSSGSVVGGQSGLKHIQS